MASIQAILFDFGNVLSKWDQTKAISYLAETFQSTNEKVIDLLKKTFDIASEGRISEQEYWEGFAAHLGSELPKNWKVLWQEFLFSTIQLDPDIIPLLGSLKQKYSLGLLTNVSPWIAEVCEKRGFYVYFDLCLFSYDLQLLKPDPEFFQFALEALECTSRECILIDDKEENIESAKKMGFQTIQHDSHEDSVESLGEKITFLLGKSL